MSVRHAAADPGAHCRRPRRRARRFAAAAGREDDIETVGEAGSGREAIFEARVLNPDVILMDVVMPDGSGLDVVPTLLHERPEMKILRPLDAGRPALRPRGVRRRRAAATSRRRRPTSGRRAIREVARGGRYVHPELGARLIAPRPSAARQAEEDPLSDREREVLRLLALGHTNQEIAKQLFISVRTAETHRAHIMQKLRLTTRAELVRYALAQACSRYRWETRRGGSAPGPSIPLQRAGVAGRPSRPCSPDGGFANEVSAVSGLRAHPRSPGFRSRCR